MKKMLLIFICLTSLSSIGQEIKPEFDGHKWQAPYHLAIPGGWTIERFLIPIAFAPQIKYKGVEDIRFTPGWATIKSDDYWTYAFLWYLDGTLGMDSATVASNLKAYYTGLLNVNTDSAKRHALPEQLTIVKTTIRNSLTEKGDSETYTGTIEMLDYMQLKPITLNCIVHVKKCSAENKTVVFYQLSPKPYQHQVWAALNKLWVDFVCKKEK